MTLLSLMKLSIHSAGYSSRPIYIPHLSEEAPFGYAREGRATSIKRVRVILPRPPCLFGLGYRYCHRIDFRSLSLATTLARMEGPTVPRPGPSSVIGAPQPVSEGPWAYARKRYPSRWVKPRRLGLRGSSATRGGILSRYECRITGRHSAA